MCGSRRCWLGCRTILLRRPTGVTLRVPGANGTASHRGRNASTPTSAFALHENEQPPPFPARSTNSPSCLLPLPPPTPLFHHHSRINNTDFRSPPSLHRMSVYRFISPNLFAPSPNPPSVTSSLLLRFTRNLRQFLASFLSLSLSALLIIGYDD